jgi:V8-like Glu-specific endopeptidase
MLVSHIQLTRGSAPGAHAALRTTIEPLLLTTARVLTFDGTRPMTNATGFFFRRGARLFLITSRHVVIDDSSGHRPDRVEIALHNDPENLTQVTVLSLPLYRDGLAVWRQAQDRGGEVDVAALELEPSLMPTERSWHSFGPEHLHGTQAGAEVGDLVQVVGYPLGFQDTLHQLPVVRLAAIASSYGLRFQGQGYFLTDARTHRGTSGAPVVMRDTAADPALPWRLLGVHSARMDMNTRDQLADESLGLNCAWYADILLTLTQDNALPAAPQ